MKASSKARRGPSHKIALLISFSALFFRSAIIPGVFGFTKHTPSVSMNRFGRDEIRPRRILRTAAIENKWEALSAEEQRLQRFRNLIPTMDALDRKILSTAFPSIINLAVVPIVNAVDTFWVGRMGIALALAGQAAANQAFFTIFFLVNYLPTITAPLVATAVGSGDTEQARQRVCESLFLSNLLGGLGMILLCAFPRVGLAPILESSTPAMEYAVPYLRVRALSMIPALVSSTGFAAFRGSLDTITPLKVSLAAKFVGAAVATAFSEVFSGVVYLKLLLKRKLVSWSQILRPPSWAALAPLVLGGSTMLGRQAALNVGFICAGRRAQSLDPTGVAAAAYGIVMQLYYVGIVIHVAMQQTAAALVPAARAQSGDIEARNVGDRMFVWNSIVGLVLGVAQMIALPWLVPMFSTDSKVQEVARLPALLSSLILAMNGPVFAGEGIMLGLRCFRDLMLITSGSVCCMIAGLSTPLAKTSINGIFTSIIAFTTFQAVAVSWHYLKVGPLAVRRKKAAQFESTI